MRMTRTAALFAVFVLLGAVSHKAAYAVSSRAPAGDYTQSDSSVPVHAFIYADHTVLELDSYSTPLQINDDSGGHISFTQDGRYARLDGKLNHFTAYVDGRPVVFTRKGWSAPKLLLVDPSPAVGASASAVAKAPIAASPALGLAPNEKLVSAPAAAHAASAAAVPAVASAAVASAASGVPPLVPAHAASSPSLDVATVTLAASGAAVVPPAPPVQIWVLRQGRLVGHELQGWAALAGWNVVWQLQRDILVPADTTYSGDFQKSAADVITTLASNGMLIHVKFYEANKTMVVSGPGTVPQ